MTLRELWYHVASLGTECFTVLQIGKGDKGEMIMTPTLGHGVHSLFLSFSFSVERVMVPLVKAKICLYLHHQLHVAVAFCLVLESSTHSRCWDGDSITASDSSPCWSLDTDVTWTWNFTSFLVFLEAMGPHGNCHPWLHIPTDPLTLILPHSYPSLCCTMAILNFRINRIPRQFYFY